MLHIHVTGCNVCPFLVRPEWKGDDWICNLLLYTESRTSEYLLSDTETAPNTIPDKCPLDVTITKETHIS